MSRARDILRGRLTRRGLSTGAVLLAGSLEPNIASAAVPLALERATIRAALIFTTNRVAAAAIASSAAVGLAQGTLRNMTMIKLTVAGIVVLALGGVAAGAARLAAVVPQTASRETPRASAQTQVQRPPDSMPGLPGAVTQPPPWLGKEGPFDVAAFFAAPPPEENAAPRYLEALFEFGEGMAVCFPEGPERESRKLAAERRSKRFNDAFFALRNGPDAVPAAEIDAMLADFDTGFRKLTWAQQRPRCVFQTAIGVTAQIPHVQVARNVTRVAVLKVRRELERGELDPALRDLARLLRLSRDLVPRGVMITDIVLAAMDGSAVREIIVPLLTTPGLTSAHCDRLFALLLEQDSRLLALDPYVEGLHAEYLSNRATLRGLVVDQDALRKEWNRFGNTAGPSIVAEIAEPTFTAMLAPNAKMPAPTFGDRLAAMAEQVMSLKNVKDLDARMARTTPEELAEQVQKLDQVYRPLLNVAGSAYVERIRKADERTPGPRRNRFPHARHSRPPSRDFGICGKSGPVAGHDPSRPGLGRGSALAARSRRGTAAVPGHRRDGSGGAGCSRATPTTSSRCASPSSPASPPSTRSARTVATTAARSIMRDPPTQETSFSGSRDPDRARRQSAKVRRRSRIYAVGDLWSGCGRAAFLDSR